METVKIIKEYEKGSQTVQIVEDEDGNQYIQIMDEMYVNRPVWQGDSWQVDELVAILNEATKEVK
jgi:hypothetical protein